ncbi:hypothetical protein MMC15_001669 [Xylographa vitiligo]|nr:hypothetical protein [Xylographa vitiligo]
MSISPAELAYQLAHIDENLGPTTIGSCAMLLVIASTAVGFRLYAKTLTSSGFGSDDYLIMAALPMLQACSIAIFAEITTFCAYGFGKHAVALTPELGMQISKALFAFEITFPLVNFSTKASLLAFYYRIFGWRWRWLKIGWWLNLVWLIALFIALYVVILTQCTPIRAFWNPGTQDLCRVSFAPSAITNSANCLSDAGILILPIPAVWKLQIPAKRKIATAGIFVLGSLSVFSPILVEDRNLTALSVLIISIVRIPVLKSGVGGTDSSYNEVPGVIWSFAEPTTGIFCACLPIVWPLCKLPWVKRTRREYGTATSGRTVWGGSGKWQGHIINDDDEQPIRELGSRPQPNEHNKIGVSVDFEVNSYSMKDVNTVEDGLAMGQTSWAQGRGKGWQVDQ